MPQGFAIAIDGPVASGKGTIAQRLAEELQGFYLSSGGMYRSVALACLTNGIDVTDPEQVIGILGRLKIQIDEDHRIILNDQDVTERITEPDIASAASIIGVIAHVRKVLLKIIQEIAKEKIEKGKIVIAEGRDMGTAVFPEAALKIYLTAKPEVRAQRRLAQYEIQNSDLEEMLQSVKERDTRDVERKASPLAMNPEEHGYVIIDNSTMTVEETVDAIKKKLQKKNLI